MKRTNFVILFVFSVSLLITGCNILDRSGSDVSSEPAPATLLGFSAQEAQQILSIAQSEKANLSLPVSVPAMSFYRFDIKNEKGGKRLSTIISYADAIATPTYGPESTAKVLLYEAKKTQAGYDFDYFEFEKNIATATIEKIVQAMVPYLNNAEFLLNSSQHLEQVSAISVLVNEEAKKIIAPAQKAFTATAVNGATGSFKLDLKPRFSSLGSTALYNMIFNGEMRDFYSKLRTGGMANSSLITSNVPMQNVSSSIKPRAKIIHDPENLPNTRFIKERYGISRTMLAKFNWAYEYFLRNTDVEIAPKIDALPNRPNLTVKASPLINDYFSLTIEANSTGTFSIPVFSTIKSQRLLFCETGEECCQDENARNRRIVQGEIVETNSLEPVAISKLRLRIWEGSRALKTIEVQLENGRLPKQTFTKIGPASNTYKIIFAFEQIDSDYSSALNTRLETAVQSVASKTCEWEEFLADTAAASLNFDPKAGVGFRISDLEIPLNKSVYSNGNLTEYIQKYRYPATGTITLPPSEDNVAPVITSHVNDAWSFPISLPENQTIVTTVTATDANVGQIVTYSITRGADLDKFAINPTTGRLVFKTAPDFENPTDYRSNNTYAVEITASDGFGGSASKMLEITITDVDENPKPRITSNNGGDTASVNVTEGSTYVTTMLATHTNASETISFGISGGTDQAKFSINSSTGRLAFTSAPNYENPTDSDTNNSYIVEVAAIDSKNASDTQTITVNITNFNEFAPEITRPANTATYSVSFAETYDFTNPVANIAATDGDFDTVTLSITGGADQDKFTMGTLGRLLFKAAPKYSDPSDSDTNNTYIVEITASDGRGKSDSITITITINGTNKHSPIIMQPDTMETYSNNIPEDFDFSNQVTSVYANDEDMGQTVSYSITGGSDQALFTMDNFGGVVFKTAPDFENPTDSDTNNSYVVEVTASDGNGGTDKITITINITDVVGH